MTMSEASLDQLSALGQRIWMDSLSRPMLTDGQLQRMIDRDRVVGVTSNPTIFHDAISGGDAYDAQLRDELGSGADEEAAFLALAVADIQAACDLLRPRWDRGKGLDGWVSIEVNPLLAHDTEATVAEVTRLREAVQRDNLYVKIPATEEGLTAIEASIANGASINVTLIFALERHRAVAEAYLRGLERLVEHGGDPATVASVASFFVSRVDTECDRRLDRLGVEGLHGKLAIANAKLAYQSYKEIFSGRRWEALAERGASPQHCLWASTSVKDERYRDVMYVEELIGPDTVTTMPPDTLAAFRDHGNVAPTLKQDIDEAREVFATIQQADVDYDDLVATLEREGVEKFSNSYRELLGELTRKRDELKLGDRRWTRVASARTESSD